MRKAALDLADRSNRHDSIGGLAKALEDDIADWPADMRTGPAVELDRTTAIYYRGLQRSMGGDAEDFGVPLFLEAEKKFDALEAANRNDPMTLYIGARNAYLGFAAASKTGQEDVSNRLILKARDTIDRLIAVEERDDDLRAMAGNIKEALAQNLRDQDRFAEAIALQQEVVAGRRDRLTRDTGRRPIPISPSR